MSDAPVVTEPAAAAAAVDTVPASFWRSLGWFNGYRLALALTLLALALMARSDVLFEPGDRSVFVVVVAAWALFAAAGFGMLAWRRPEFQLQIALHVCADVVFVALLVYATGGISSGFGLLLLANLAAAGIISRGRLTLFYASLASVAVLLEHTWDVLFEDG
ncbi:MAG: hypothetical protein MUF30_04785, partial [Burkholderiales bacterium]|nr:hypothetical protein [Burkholderiales bacterium]